MREFIIMLLICSITISVLALFYMTIMPLLAKRYSAISRYYSWLIFVIGLIIPFRPQFNNAFIKVGIPSNTTMPIIQIGSMEPVSVPVVNSLSSSISNISLWEILVIVWLVGMIVFLAYHVIKHCRFLKLSTRWSENITDKQIIELMQNLKDQMGLTKNIGLQFCDSIGSPMIIGFINPCILLPRANYAKDELYFILKHELVHYKHKDLWYKGLVLIATSIHWFNPIVYLMAKAINIQCEISCDEEVIRNTGAYTRQCYSETIIGVIRYQSKLKTVLSTNFYGGKKGMKKRIFSIMDMSKKKTGATVLCSVLIFTLSAGFAFASNTETQNSPEWIQENTNKAFAYKILPNPEIYSQYSSYGITISDDGKMLLYNGQRVKLFADEHSDTQAFFLDEAGTINLSVVRNAAGNITNIENISENKAQQYYSDFFADDTIPQIEVKETVQEIVKETTGTNKLEQYSSYGITLSENGDILYYNNQRVKLLVDMLSDGSFKTYWVDEDGTVNLSVLRDSTGQITNIESISEEQAQEYRSVADKYE